MQEGEHMIRRSIPLLVLTAALAANANAATHARANFCTASKSVVVQLVNTASALRSSATLVQRQAELKTQFTTIKAAEPALRSNVPARLKRRLNAVLALADLINTKLAAVHWNIAAIVQNQAVAAQIEAAGARADAAMPALRSYYRKTCHYKT
jgi:hypothetical protein